MVVGKPKLAGTIATEAANGAEAAYEAEAAAIGAANQAEATCEAEAANDILKLLFLVWI